jgi:MFS transporter, MCT family, solute carrier family 16 (monocarboxylic acid transporters), member 3
VTSGVSTPARLLIGMLSDLPILSPLTVFQLSTGSLVLTFFMWPLVRSGAIPMYLWAAAFGFANGAAQGGFVAAVASRSLAPDPRTLGARMGVVCGVIAFATLAGPPIAGAILDSSAAEGPAQYLGVQLWSGSVELLALAVLGAMAWSVRRRSRAAVTAAQENKTVVMVA